MAVIGIDTAGRLGGVGVVSAGRLLGATVLGVEEGHSQNLLPALESLMERLDPTPAAVDGIAVAIGPGSYTGLRIGVAVAKALGYAWGVPVRGVSTLLATAWPLAGVAGMVCACLDARKEHVYSATFSGRQLGFAGEALSTQATVTPQDRRSVIDVAKEVQGYLANGMDVYLVGDGVRVVLDEVRRTMDGGGEGPNVIVPPLLGEAARAAHVAHIGELELSRGQSDDLFELSPNYLRRSEAERRWRQKLLSK